MPPAHKLHWETIRLVRSSGQKFARNCLASTLLNESGKWHPDAIERALAHGDTEKVHAAYPRGAHWNERVEMAQSWSDYLDSLRMGALI